MFTGLTEDVYRFFWDIAFHNDREYFEANRERYRESVQKPLQELVQMLNPTVQQIDDRLNIRPAAVLSRIRRDTRYSKDKSLYRDHAWLGYKMPGSMVSECFTIYAEFEREQYGYGMGMYAPNPELMSRVRNQILAKPQKFLELITEPEFQKTFTVEGELYKRPRYTEVPEALLPFVNRRNLSFCYTCDQLQNTMQPEIYDEIRDAFLLMKPVYRFLMGLS